LILTGDGKADVSVFRPDNAAWYVQQSQNGFTGVQFGISTDRIVPADYDATAKPITPFSAAVLVFAAKRARLTGIAFGFADDIPVPADMTATAKRRAVFRPANGTGIYSKAQMVLTGIQFGLTATNPWRRITTATAKRTWRS
jgi:hypothetical protein